MKRKVKRILSLLLCVLLLCGVMPFAVSAADVLSGDCGANGDNVKWYWYADNGLLELKGTGAMANYSYSSAPWHAFWSSIRSAVIYDGVTHIGDYTFNNCTQMTSIKIPDSVTTIGNNAFDKCQNLVSITIPDGVTSIGDDTFYNCKSLTGISIPDSVTRIGDRIFSYCISLTNVTISGSVTRIGYFAFHKCTSLTSATIPNSVTSIGDSAFSECTNLTSVTIGNSVTSIENYAFSGCSSLASVTIPNSVRSIGNSAFSRCTSLLSVIIGSGTKLIGEQAFYNCSALINVCYNGTEAEWGTIHIAEGNDRLIFAPRTYRPIESLTLSESSLTMHFKGTKTLTANCDVEWSSSDDKVVTVDASGKLTAVGKGKATVTATDIATGDTAKCEVSVKYSFVQILIRILLFGWIWYK